MNNRLRGILNGSDEMEVTIQLNTEQQTPQSTKESPKVVKTDMLDIGKPYLFRKEIDPNGIGKETLEKKMGIIEITPCKWNFPIPDVENIQSLKLSNISKPKVTFFDAIQQFQNDCGNYQLKNNYSGIRLHLTQQSTSDDIISNTYDPNVLESTIDTLRQTKIGEIAKTLNRYDLGTGGVVSGQIGQTLNSIGFTQNSGVGSAVTDSAKSITDVLLMQQKISFPKIWKDSDYTPNVSVRIKLFSPYGHPEAITKFIIAPLCYLLLLCSPKTNDGLSYGYPHSLHVRGYGFVHIPLAFPQSISWQRGGDDNSFSIYRQPTVVDVTLNLQGLISGFGYYTGKESNIPHSERTINALKYSVNDTHLYDTQVSFMTLGNIIDSFRPYLYNEGA